MAATLTMAAIRAQFPAPSVSKPAEIANIVVPPKTVNPPCYCVGGALMLAIGKKWRKDDGTLIEGTLFPQVFWDDLEDVNPRLERRVTAGWLAKLSISDLYEAAIMNANDLEELFTPDAGTKTIEDHFELAWQLLDDALTYDPKTFGPAHELRLLSGLLMAPIAAIRLRMPRKAERIYARYKELSATTKPGGLDA